MLESHKPRIEQSAASPPALAEDIMAAAASGVQSEITAPGTSPSYENDQPDGVDAAGSSENGHMPAGEPARIFTEPVRPTAYQIPRTILGAEIVEAVDTSVYYAFRAATAEDRLRYVGDLNRRKVHPGAGEDAYAKAQQDGVAMSYAEMVESNIAEYQDETFVNQQRSQADAIDGYLPPEIALARRQLNFLDKNGREMMQDYLDRELPAFFKFAAEEYVGAGDKGWVDWLTDSENGATDAQLTNFLQWNVHWNEARQHDPEFVAMVNGERAQFKAVAEQKVVEGWFSEEAMHTLAKVDETKVWIGDPIHMTIRHIRGEAGSDITIAPPEISGHTAAEEAHEVVPHEFTHVGLQRTPAGDPMEARWSMEGFAELCTRIMRPDFSSEAYSDEQRLIFTVVTRGTRALDIRLGTRAFTGSASEKQEFYEGVDAAWGIKDTWSKITGTVHFLQNRLAGDDPTSQEDRIEALRMTNEILLRKPELIFGKDYKKPMVAADERRP